MNRNCLSPAASATPPRFDSPLALWIAIWQRQLVDGMAPAAVSLE
jgi:hypothetical protein